MPIALKCWFTVLSAGSITGREALGFKTKSAPHMDKTNVIEAALRKVEEEEVRKQEYNPQN